MNETDLRELDGWIAEKFLGWKRIEDDKLWRTPDDENGKGVTFRYPFKFSSDVIAFALVKREIERRGWDWMCERATVNEPPFLFSVFVEVILGPSDIYHGEADSEELAGCLAVKAAVEGSNAHSD